VLTEDWLKDSGNGAHAKELIPLLSAAMEGNYNQDEQEYRQVLEQSAIAQRYLVQDRAKERQWGFSLVDTLATIHCSCIEEEEEDEQVLVRRRVRGHVFEGHAVYVTKGVCGVTAPSGEEMQAIVESGGGLWVESAADFKKRNNKSISRGDPLVLLLISHTDVAHKELKASSMANKEAKELWEMSLQSGAQGIYSTELLFLACLRQRLQLDEDGPPHVLPGMQF
jgi:hypothetical protein